MRTYVCELKSGLVQGDYPFQIDQALERRIGDYRTGTFILPILDEGTPPDWRDHVVPWRSLIVVCDDDDEIIWAGIPDDIETDAEPVVRFPTVTLEKYFDRRYMPTRSFVGQDQTSSIARFMAEWCGDEETGIGLEYSTPASGIRRDREYHSDEDARILNRLQQLASVINGFEWTIDVEWTSSSRRAVRKVFRTGYPTLGNVTEEPAHVFEFHAGHPGPVVDFSHSTLWSEGDAATHVQAVGDGEGEDKPTSKVIINTTREQQGWPRLEERATQQGVSERATLDLYADAMAATFFGGQETFEFEAQMDAWPTPRDIQLGDTALVSIETDQLVTEEVWRIIGYSIEPAENRWKPMIARMGEAY